MKVLFKNSCIRRAFACMMMLALVITAAGVPAVSAKKAVAGKTIKLSKKKATLTVGEKVTLKAKVNPKKATVTWKTSNKKVATVKAGKVTAKTEGTAKITASIKTKAGKTKKAVCKVTVKAADVNQSQGPDTPTGTGGGTTTSGGAVGGGGAAAEEMKPVPAPAAQPDNPEAPEVKTTGKAMMYIGSDADVQLLKVEQDITAAGTVNLTGKVTGTAAMKTFYIDTGIAVASTVYKISAATLKIRGNDVKNKNTETSEFAVTESANGTWEVVFINGTGAGDTKLKGGSNGSVAADDEITCTYTVTAQTPEEAAISRAKAFKRIPLTAGDGNNRIEAEIKVTGYTGTPAEATITMGYQPQRNNTESAVWGEHKNAEGVVENVVTLSKDKDTYTLALTGLNDTPDLEVLEIYSNISNKDENLIIQMTSIKVNGHSLVIANTPKKTATTYRYMVDSGTTGNWEACARNMYNYTKDASSPSANQLAWDYIGTAVKDDGRCYDNISRNYFY